MNMLKTQKTIWVLKCLISTRTLPNKYLQKIRDYINNSKNILTYREQPPGLTIFFDSNKEGIVHKKFKHIYNQNLLFF